MSRLPIASRRHDPYWDMDGVDARHQRTKQRVVRLTTWLAIVMVLGFVLTRLPAVDPEYLVHGGGRPLLAGALMTILGTAALLALARIRHVSRG